MIIAGAGGAAHLPGHDGREDAPAGARRAGRVEGAEGHRLAAVDRADAGRRPGRRRSRSAGPARSTRRCSPRRSSALQRRRRSRERAAAPSAPTQTRDASSTNPIRAGVGHGDGVGDRSAAASSAGCSRWPATRSASRSASSIPRADVAGRRRSATASSAPTTTADALARLAAGVDVVTYEFENVPVDAARGWPSGRAGLPAARRARGRAGPARREDALRRRSGIPVPPFARGRRRARSSRRPSTRSGLPAVLKTRRLGYDGKGQVVLRTPAESPRTPGRALGERAARSSRRSCRSSASCRSSPCAGRTARLRFYPLVENHHRDGILRAVAARPAPELAASSRRRPRRTRARSAERSATSACSRSSCSRRTAACSANEMAPRVHNSGPLDDRGRRDEPVREPPARDLRPAARRRRRPAGTSRWST